MNVLNLTGIVIVAAAALCTLWGVAGRIDSGRHRRVDTVDAHALAALRLRWNSAGPAHVARHGAARRIGSEPAYLALPPAPVRPAIGWRADDETVTVWMPAGVPPAQEL
jgi:hypothetical protein